MTAQDWYHATPAGDRVGPMTADDLARLYQAGRIPATTPVWQAGMADWVPLASVAARLGLPPIPPPLRQATPPPPRRGMHWIWITLLVVAGLSVPVLAILAAIAIPAYNDYRLRAGLSDVMASAIPLQVQIGAAITEGRVCPIIGDAPERITHSTPDVDAALSILRGHRHVEGVMTHDGHTTGHCEILLKLEGFDRTAIDGEVLSWTLDPANGRWTCSSTVPERYLPSTCRH